MRLSAVARSVGEMMTHSVVGGLRGEGWKEPPARPLASDLGTARGPPYLMEA